MFIYLSCTGTVLHNEIFVVTISFYRAVFSESQKLIDINHNYYHNYLSAALGATLYHYVWKVTETTKWTRSTDERMISSAVNKQRLDF